MSEMGSPAPLRRDTEVVEVKRFVDEHGVACVRVPLRVHRLAPFPTDAMAILEEADWDYLTGLTRGASPSLSLMLNGPRDTRTRRRKVGRVQTWDATTKANQHVARIILKAGRGEVVRHRDGNILDLRRHNLIMDAGRATDREQHAIAKRRDKVARTDLTEATPSATLPRIVKRRKRKQQKGVKAASRTAAAVPSPTPRISPSYERMLREALASQRGVAPSSVTASDIAALLDGQ